MMMWYVFIAYTFNIYLALLCIYISVHYVHVMCIILQRVHTLNENKDCDSQSEDGDAYDPITFTDETVSKLIIN